MFQPILGRHGRLARAGGQWLALTALLGGAAGCGTTRVTNTQRTATEQLLVSTAIDQSISRLDFRALAGKPVYFDAQYLSAGAERGYVVSSLRQHLLACGCILAEDRARATYVVEARSGGIGTDQHQLLLGVPQMNVPSLVPGQPSAIPEIPLAKKSDQKGVAKLAVFAYNRRTGRPVWQSGVVQSDSTSKDTWVLGAGPFRRGTLGEATDFAGRPVAIPLLSGREGGSEEEAAVLAVTRPAVWREAFDEPGPYRLTGESTAAEPPRPPASRPAERGSGEADGKAVAAPAKDGGQPEPRPSMPPIHLPGLKPTTADAPGKESAPRKATNAPTPAPKRAP